MLRGIVVYVIISRGKFLNEELYGSSSQEGTNVGYCEA